MQTPTVKSEGTSAPRAMGAVVAAEARWENEGGATPNKAVHEPVAALHVLLDSAAVATATSALDNRQDELMTLTSSDGQPPARWLRLVEWRLLTVGGALILGGAVAWMAISRVRIEYIAAGAGFVFLLMFAASPVIGAALQRGREERAARGSARAERGETGVAHSTGDQSSAIEVSSAGFNEAGAPPTPGGG